MPQFALLYITIICLLFLWCVKSVTQTLGFQGHIISPQTPENSFQCWHLLLLEKEMAPHSSILAWKIPWTEEPGRLQSMESQRVRQDLVIKQQHLPLQSLAFIIQPLQIFLQCWGSPHWDIYIYILTTSVMKICLMSTQIYIGRVWLSLSHMTNTQFLAA